MFHLSKYIEYAKFNSTFRFVFIKASTTPHRQTAVGGAEMRFILVAIAASEFFVSHDTKNEQLDMQEPQCHINIWICLSSHAWLASVVGSTDFTGVVK